MAKKKATLRASFSGVSTAKNARTIGVKLDRSEVTLEEAEQLLVNSQLECKIVYTPRNGEKDDADQATMDFAEQTFEGIAECFRLSVGAESFGFKLAFPRKETSVGLEQAAYTEGKLTLRRTGDAKVDGQGDAEDDEDETPDLPFEEAPKRGRRRQTADV